MVDLKKEDLDNIFLNVRKSYRLLYEYQKRVLDLVKFIGNYFDYSYSGGWPQFSNSCPKDGKGSLDNWAWDWLNMYAYGFYFGEKEVGEEKITFEIRLYSDTGFYDAGSEHKNKTSLENFKPEEKSKTKIVLVASSKGWAINDLLSNFNSSRDEYNNTEDNNICAKSYDLSNFLDEEKTKSMLKDFIDFCLKYNIKIKEPQKENL